MPKYIIKDADALKRLDKFVCEKTEISRSLCKEAILNETITVNNSKAKQSYLLKVNDSVEVGEIELTDYEIIPEDLHLEYVYNDDDLCVVNKPSGMVVHPAPGALEHTLVHGLMFDLKDSLSGINGVLRPGIVHRIDKDTSGLLVVAKSDLAHHGLTEQLKNHSMKRVYYALVYGVINEAKGRINAPIGRDLQDRLKMACVKDGKEAITNFTVLKRFKDMTLVKCQLETGRTHQIRVHFKYIGHPVVGDPIYGPHKVIGDHGQFLHAGVLGFVHPRTKEFMEFETPLPDYFKNYLEELEKSGM